MKKSFLIFIIFIFLIVTLPLRTLDTWMPSDIRIDTGDIAGSSDSAGAQIACSDNNIYTVWHDDRNGYWDIYFNYSTDGGINWQSSAIRLDTGDPPGVSPSSGPQIACFGNKVYVVWDDYRSYGWDIYFCHSTDGGANWSPDFRLDTGDLAGANNSYDPQIASSGNNVYVVWEDYRNGNADIYLNYSSDGGVNWQTSDIRLDTGDTAGANFSIDPQIACTGSHVYVVWEDYRTGGPDIYFNYSTDNGMTWQSSDIRLDTDMAGFCISEDPQIACYESYVYAVWKDDRIGGTGDIYFNYSTDNGATWMSTDIRLDTGDTLGTSESRASQIACTGSHVYAVWHDDRNGSADIYFNYSTNNGATWQPSDIRLDTGDPPGVSPSSGPQIACFSNNVCAVWNDLRNGAYDIYCNYSIDNGVNWQSSAIRLDSGDTPGTSSSLNPQIACTENNVYAIWGDNRNGDSDVYFNRAVPGTDIKANGSDGPISITQSDTLQIKVTLISNGLSTNVDYWLAYKGPSGWVHYNNTTKKWETGLGVTHQGALMDLNNKKVFQKSGLSPGAYRFYFGVDMVMDGNLTKSQLYYDMVKVTVTSD